MKPQCSVCEEPILTNRKNEALSYCEICNRPICYKHIYHCGQCDKFVCINDLVNFRGQPPMKASEWKNLRCKTCQKKVTHI